MRESTKPADNIVWHIVYIVSIVSQYGSGTITAIMESDLVVSRPEAVTQMPVSIKSVCPYTEWNGHVEEEFAHLLRVGRKLEERHSGELDGYPLIIGSTGCCYDHISVGGCRNAVGWRGNL